MNFIKNNFRHILSALLICFSVSTFGQTTLEKTAIINKNSLDNSLSRLIDLEPISFQYKAEVAHKFKLPSGTTLGFDPVSTKKVYPNLIVEENRLVAAGKNSFKNENIEVVNMEQLIPLLVGSIKEQQKQIENLQKQLNELTTKIKE